MKGKITFERFLQLTNELEIKTGFVRFAERVPKSDKLLKLTVYFGGDDTRIVVTNLGDKFEPERFIRGIYPFVTNLESSKMMGITSEAMILASTSMEGNVNILHLNNNSPFLVGATII